MQGQERFREPTIEIPSLPTAERSTSADCSEDINDVTLQTFGNSYMTRPHRFSATSSHSLRTGESKHKTVVSNHYSAILRLVLIEIPRVPFQ
jgi:hypothetical protein